MLLVSENIKQNERTNDDQKPSRSGHACLYLVYVKSEGRCMQMRPGHKGVSRAAPGAEN